MNRPSRLGLSPLLIVGLSSLALPRAILHDLHVIESGTLPNLLLVVVPPLIWIAVAQLRRVPNPFLTVLSIGSSYGVLLAVTHQVLWQVNVGDASPSLGGAFEGTSPVVEAVIVRGAAVISSLVTGALVGALAGALAWASNAALTRRR